MKRKSAIVGVVKILFAGWLLSLTTGIAVAAEGDAAILDMDSEFVKAVAAANSAADWETAGHGFYLDRRAGKHAGAEGSAGSGSEE
jgi:hypothetical protein